MDGKRIFTLRELEYGSLIPGLPNHIAILCLLKVPRLHHFSLRAVCSLWSAVFRSPEFYQGRKNLGLVDSWLMVLSTDLMASAQLYFSAYDLQSKRLLFKAKLPPYSFLQRAGILYYRLAAIDESFVLLGGKRSARCSPVLDQLLIFNTLSNKWRRGVEMRAPRYCFACGVIKGKLYVAGGFSRAGTMERSTEVYDLLTDEWRTVARIPDGIDNIEADVVFQDKLYIVGCVYEKQQRMFWVYDPQTNAWEEQIGMAASFSVGGELVATEKCIYNLSFDDVLYKFGGEGDWRVVGQAWEADNTTFNIHAQRAFGHANEVFVLSGGMAGHTTLLCEDECLCHRLFLGASWYRAGAIVQA